MTVRHTVRTGLQADILATAVPAWGEARDAAERLKAEVIRRQGDRPAPGEDRRTVTAALIAAKTTADIQSALDAARLDAARREAEGADLEALTTARAQVEDELENIERRSTPEVVNEVRERVQDIVDEIRDLDHRPRSAQEALDLDAGNEWKRLQKLVSAWTQLVSAYTALVRTEIDGPGITVLSSAAFIRDPLAHPYFLERRAKAGRANDQPQPGSFHAAMWAWSESAPAPCFNTDAPRGGNSVPPGADPLAWVLHLVDNDQVAVHEPHHALELWRLAEEATQEITAHNAEDRAMARGRYAQAIGDEDLETIADLKPVLEATPRHRRKQYSTFIPYGPVTTI